MNKDRVVLGLLALAALQVLHLLDELRTDETADLASILLRPQPILGIGGTLAAAVAVRRGSRFRRAIPFPPAIVVARGFILSHGVPGGSEPYWGDGSADALQWLGVSLILACCAAIAVLLVRVKEAA